MEQYKQSTQYIDWQEPIIVDQAKLLTKETSSDEDITRRCFEFVRDEIKHSWDHKLDPVTVKASDVLKYGTGYCYAKSHLLAALLRANNIAAGLCYQRLTINNDRPPFCLHGLNAVYLEPYGWYRLDPRGNKLGVNAQFTPPIEQLAFPIVTEGEADLPEIWAEPLPLVVGVLNKAQSYKDVASNLPDIPLFK
jgi:transglutaminase-like putative cysteine protease